MDFSPQSVFWDCLYSRCCEEMDTYLRPGSFWERIPNGHLRDSLDVALRHDWWRWFHEIYFQERIANRRSLKYPKFEIDLYEALSNRMDRFVGYPRWRCLSYKDKVKAAKTMLKEFQEGSFASLDDYLNSGACYFKGTTSSDIETVLTSKKIFSKRSIEEKLVAGIISLGWDWKFKRDGDFMIGEVNAFGRPFMLRMWFEEKFFLTYSLSVEVELGRPLFSEGYSWLLGMGPDGLESFGFADLDADVETFMIMLSRLAWLVATSLDDAEKGVAPTFVHHPPPAPLVEEPQKEAICGCVSRSTEVTKEEKELLALLKTEGFVRPDTQEPSDLYELIESVVESGSEKLLLLDTECVNDGSEYAAILEKLNEVAGEKVVEGVTSFLDPEKSVAGVQFTVGGKVYKGKWNQDDDWMSSKFAELLVKAMEHIPGRFVTLPGEDQCARILYFKSRDTGDKAEELLARIKEEKM